MCYIDGQENKYSVLNECNRMLKYNILSHERKGNFRQLREFSGLLRGCRRYDSDCHEVSMHVYYLQEGNPIISQHNNQTGWAESA
jgi:hypothetical protein